MLTMHYGEGELKGPLEKIYIIENMINFGIFLSLCPISRFDQWIMPEHFEARFVLII